MNSYTHNTGAFIGREGYEIFFQSWSVASPKALLVIAHGLGEHSGRYAALAESLRGRGLSIYALDHRGHGRSGGKRGHVDSFSDFVFDLKQFIDFVSESDKGLPLILLGHSMGGVIALKYAMTYPDDLSSIIISSPGLVPAFEIPPLKKKIGEIFSKYIPGLTMSNGLVTKDLSHDAKVVEDYERDPLVHDRVTTRWYTEFTKAAAECLADAAKLTMPGLYFHGSQDRMVDYRATVEVYEKAKAAQKELHIFDGLYHETMNEIQTERAKVIEVIISWIEKIIGRGKPAVKAAAPKKTSAAKPKAKPAAKKTVKKAKPAVKAKPVAKKPAAPKKTAAVKPKVKPAVKKAVKPKSSAKKKK
jgi:alpha-beta hydrolase superfamily lysophospholipase